MRGRLTPDSSQSCKPSSSRWRNSNRGSISAEKRLKNSSLDSQVDPDISPDNSFFSDAKKGWDLAGLHSFRLLNGDYNDCYSDVDSVIDKEHEVTAQMNSRRKSSSAESASQADGAHRIRLRSQGNESLRATPSSDDNSQLGTKRLNPRQSGDGGSASEVGRQRSSQFIPAQRKRGKVSIRE